MIVYKITNLENGKIYVGQTKFTVEKRFREHAKAESLIGNAIRKYGEEHFDYEVLETCETREQAYEREIFFIDYFDCMSPNGYNLTEGGIHNPNFGFYDFIKETVSFISQNGDEWVIWYRESIEDLTVNAPFAALKVFLNLASKQEFEGGISTTKQAVADSLKISYDNVMRGFKWLKENSYVKERKVNGQTQFLLNPRVTTCGKNRKAKIKLWEETP